MLRLIYENSIQTVVLIPHLGTSTKITHDGMANIAAQNIINALEGKKMVAPAYEYNSNYK